MLSEVLEYARTGNNMRKAASTEAANAIKEEFLDSKIYKDVSRYLQEADKQSDTISKIVKNIDDVAGKSRPLFSAIFKHKPTAMERASAVLSSVGSGIKNNMGKAAIPALVIGAFALKRVMDEVKKDPRRRQIFASICADPEFREIDRGKLLEWYATLKHYAPNTTLDKNATRAILRQFKLYGTVDLQTIKSLADIEKSQIGASKDIMQLVSWAVN